MQRSRKNNWNKKILSEGVIEIINEKLNYLKENISNVRDVSIKYFLKDNKKKVGRYVLKCGTVKKIDVNGEMLYFKDGTIVKFNDILSIDIEDFCW